MIFSTWDAELTEFWYVVCLAEDEHYQLVFIFFLFFSPKDLTAHLVSDVLMIMFEISI